MNTDTKECDGGIGGPPEQEPEQQEKCQYVDSRPIHLTLGEKWEDVATITKAEIERVSTRALPAWLEQRRQDIQHRIQFGVREWPRCPVTEKGLALVLAPNYNGSEYYADFVCPTCKEK